MAENKKSALLYCDLIHTIEALKDNEAGRVFKHFLRYINDQNPKAPDRLTEIIFEPIKQGLKRDLRKYENTCKRNKENIDKRWANKDTKNTTGKNRIPHDTKNTDRGIDTDSDKDNDTEIKTKEAVRENVFLHRKEIEKLKSQYSAEEVEWMFDKLSAYKLSKGKNYKSDYGAITSWVVDRLKEEKTKEKNSAKKENGKDPEQRSSDLAAFINR